MGFFTVLTMGFGSIFFVLLQHLTGAGWSVTVRRTSEFFAAGMIVVPLLALPNLLGREQLYPWWTHGSEGVAHAQEHVPASGATRGVDRVRSAVTAEAHGEEVEAEGEIRPRARDRGEGDRREAAVPELDVLLRPRGAVLPRLALAGAAPVRLLDRAGQERRSAVDGQAAALRAGARRSCSRCR